MFQDAAVAMRLKEDGAEFEKIFEKSICRHTRPELAQWKLVSLDKTVWSQYYLWQALAILVVRYSKFEHWTLEWIDQAQLSGITR